MSGGTGDVQLWQGWDMRPYEEPGVAGHEKGPAYVLASDYDALAARVAELEEERALLRSAVQIVIEEANEDYSTRVVAAARAALML